MSYVQFPLPYIDVEGRAAAPNSDIYGVVQIHLDGDWGGVGITEADLVNAVKSYLSGITGAAYPISAVVATKHAQADSTL